MRTKYGNFLPDADVFDNSFFRISPREARSMDPQQRILLHVAYHALEDAGYVPDATSTFNPDMFGCYVGAATNDYVQNLRNDVDVYYSTGMSMCCTMLAPAYVSSSRYPSGVPERENLICLRIWRPFYSRRHCLLVVHGRDIPSMPRIDCWRLSCRPRRWRECHLKPRCRSFIALLAMTVANYYTQMYMGLDRAHFLSPTGQCRPWDASADGYCRAEGCGMFVLKRLSDAVAENDRILGVIRGIEVNQSGKADSITHPHIDTQMRLYEQLLTSTGICPHDISVIEAHGTGTQAGDPKELEGLRRVFAAYRTADNPLHITSVKANIGHAEAASGAASLAKLVLMMHNRTIPATISFKQLNPRIPDLSTDNIRIDTVPVSWDVPDGQRRLAMLNNFGAAGSNSALILEEPPVQIPPSRGSPPTTIFIGLSCESEEAARQLRDAYVRELSDHVQDQSALADFAYTATARRQLHSYRISAYGSTPEEVCARLHDAPIIRAESQPQKVGFVFSGQGGQYLGMGSGLYDNVPAFRRVVDECHHKLLSWGFPGILDVIRAMPASASEPAGIDDLEMMQTSTFVLECALASLWTSWGLIPDVVVGHR